jgi:hypothetical protein
MGRIIPGLNFQCGASGIGRGEDIISLATKRDIDLTVVSENGEKSNIQS